MKDYMNLEGLIIPSTATKTLEGDPVGSRPVPMQVLVPPSGPPRSWLDANGLTPGCYGCKGLSERNSARGRFHSRACKKRYENYLREQIRLREQAQQEGARKDDEGNAEEPLRKRIRGKVTDPPGYPSAPASVDPGVPASGSGDVVPPSPVLVPPGMDDDVDIDMGDGPVGDESGPMDVEALVHVFLVEQETQFLRGFPTKSAGKMIWFKK